MEDSEQVGEHERARHQSPSEHLEVHLVANARPVSIRIEPMGVPPGPVGTTDLLVHEPSGRIPSGDDRSPSDREATKAQAIVDRRALSHRERRGEEKPEVEPARGQLLKVLGAGEEVEHLGERSAQPYIGLQAVAGGRKKPLACGEDSPQVSLWINAGQGAWETKAIRNQTTT